MSDERFNPDQARAEAVFHLDRTGIEAVLPHRRPFMFLESADVIEPGIHATGILADLSDPEFNYLEGHFPGNRITPGLITAEALAELAGIAAFARQGKVVEESDRIGVLVAADKFRFRRMLRPDSKVTLDARITEMKRLLGTSHVRAFVNEELAVEGDITFLITDKAKQK